MSAWVMTRTETGLHSSNSRLSQSSSMFQERPPTKRTLEGAEKSPSCLTFLAPPAGAASASALRFLDGSSTFFSSSSSESDESESDESEDACGKC